MKKYLLVAFIVILSMLGPRAITRAGESPPEGEVTERSAEGASKADVDALILDLDANRFSKRQAASAKLRQLGKTATAALAKAALGTSREAATRSVEILAEQFAQGDGELKKAAETALKKIAESGKPAVARRAKEILHRKPAQPVQQARPMMPGQIQIQVQGIAIGQGIQIRNVNGVKTSEAKEKGRSVKIVDDPNNGISVTITETKNNKKTTRQFQAKDAAELKKKHPEAFKAYEKYKGKGAMFQAQGIIIGGGGLPGLPGGAIPQIRLQAARPVHNKNRDIARQLKDVARQLDETRELLEKITGAAGDATPIKKALEQLEKAKKELEDARAKIEK